MVNHQISTARPKRRPLRTAFALIAVLGLGFIVFSLLANFILENGWVGGDRVAVVRIEGVILDAHKTIEELANVKGLLEKVGVQSIVIKSGRYKDMASPFRAMSEEDRALLQGVLDDVHAQFIEAVATGRAMQIEQVRNLADGRIFTGRQ